MTAVIIGGLLTSCGSAYNNANGKNSDNTVETQTTVRTVVNGETKTDGNNVKTADKETGDFTQEVTSEENNLTDNDIASNTEASEQQAFDDLSQAGGYENNSGQESWGDSGSGDDYQNSDGESYGDGDSSDNSEETDIPSASETVNSDYNLLARAQINTVTYSAYANEVLRLVNIERANAGVAPLVLDEALCNAANMRAIEMDCTGVFGHKRPNDHSCFEVYDICNVEWQNACGENIAAGQATPEDVMKSWLSSAGHKANILSPEYTKMGLGYSNSGCGAGRYSHYWGEEFAVYKEYVKLKEPCRIIRYGSFREGNYMRKIKI